MPFAPKTVAAATAPFLRIIKNLNRIAEEQATLSINLCLQSDDLANRGEVAAKESTNADKIARRIEKFTETEEPTS